MSILGINPPGYESGNDAMCAGRVLPWLQEVKGDAVWSDWGVTYRDVVVLDGENKVTGVYNLTEHDLSDSGNRDALKQLLRKAASSSTR